MHQGPTCTASRAHMQTPSTLVLTISTQLAVLPSKRWALLRPRPALFTRICVGQKRGQRAAQQQWGSACRVCRRVRP